MTQITHSQTLPKNIDYWDYYILCRCDDAASKVLQRMEYWDGTKIGGNVHNEKDNDHAVDAGKVPTQDISRYVYKTREELAWEMIGAVKERSAYVALDDIIKLRYLKSRHNPYKTFDRTLQYEFQFNLVQAHLNQLYAIIQCFSAHGREQRPILYAIERLVEQGVYINRVEDKDGVLDGKDVLSIALVAEQLSLMHTQMHLDEEEGKKKPVEGQKKYKPLLPTFIKQDLKKDEAREFNSAFPLCKNAQCIHTFLHNASIQKCTMECANLHNALCAKTQAIPMTTITVTTNSNYKTVKGSKLSPTEHLSVDSAHADIDHSHNDSLLEKHTHKNEETQEDKQIEQVQQPALIENGPPVMPAKTAKWNTETLVQIVEAKRNKRFEEVVRNVKGKVCRTQRERQLEAAKVVIQSKFTREQFEQAYDYRNDDWWIEKKGDLTVVDMTANTSRKVMRMIEVLEAIAVADRKNKRTSAPASIPQENVPLETMPYNEACKVAEDAIAKGKQHGYVIDAKVYSSGSGWLVNVVWDGQELVPIESRAMWNEQFTENHQFEQELKQQEQRKAK
jgi:hypothetical protein